MSSRTERLEEEVEFWERFIRDWALGHCEPVPWRAYQALMLARGRLQQALDSDRSANPFSRRSSASGPFEH